MATEPTTESELEALRARVGALETELTEQAARANAAVAAAQDRAYWLDRWHVDLNAIMRRRGASELRASVRALRAVYRGAVHLRGRARALWEKRHDVATQVAEERALAEQGDGSEFLRALSPDPLRATPVTDLLYARLEDGDLRDLERRLSPRDAALWAAADEADRKRLALAFALHYGVRGALERTGLSPAEPPKGVHAMARGAQAAGGSTYYADMVVDGLGRAGAQMSSVRTALDFGCSSGRVVRVLAAAFPEVEWHGCDPIGDAVAWAGEHLPGIAFVQSSENPPLPYEAGRFDLAFAISIWSHFSESAALAWLDEMGRILRRGGFLVLTTHGLQTLTHDAARGLRGKDQLGRVAESLRDQGFWFENEFGKGGDHGIDNPDWGTAFLSPEWLLARATPTWRVAFFAPGRVEDNQDLYVLERN